MTAIDRNPGWTGGQHSLFRMLLAGCLLGHFLGAGWEAGAPSPEPHVHRLLWVLPDPWAPGAGPGPLACAVAILAGLALLIGWWDRLAALVLLYLWAGLYGDLPISAAPGAPAVGGLLIAQLLLPGRPYGAWSARGRPDPAGDWHRPAVLHRIGWLALVGLYGYRGVWRWLDPGSAGAAPFILGAAEVLFVVFAWPRRLRRWAWSGMAVLQVGLVALGAGEAPLLVGGLGVVLLHLFTFEPRWLPPAGCGQPVTVYFDGTCGLCHRGVRFVLAEDRGGAVAVFAPLQVADFADGAPLPDSVAVRRADGTLLFRSAAVLCVLRRLGGAWRALATVAGWLPGGWLDLGYRLVARWRARWFRRPASLCPQVPAHLASRFAAAGGRPPAS